MILSCKQITLKLLTTNGIIIVVIATISESEEPRFEPFYWSVETAVGSHPKQFGKFYYDRNLQKNFLF